MLDGEDSLYKYMMNEAKHHPSVALFIASQVCTIFLA